MTQQFYINGRWIGVEEMKRKRKEAAEAKKAATPEVVQEEAPKRKGRPPREKV